MKLTRAERWILANQCRILEKLYPEEAKHLAETREALESGYSLHYAPEYIDKNELTEQECREVLDILSMCYDIKHSYDRLADKAGIDAWRVEFRGFDGNEETKQLQYARFFCKHDGGRFKDLVPDGEVPNSHAPLTRLYRAMLPRWREWKEGLGIGGWEPMTKEEIIRITALPG
jgi:uncharacterized protein YfbU (UPF0304 family)